VWSHAAIYDPARASPMVWILTIARSKSIDLLRSRTRRVEKHRALEEMASLEEPAPNPEAVAVQAERCAQVQAALASLPREQRVAIETAYFAGLSHSEVAAALGEPLGTVKSRIRLGLSSLRRALGEVA
jgi:RNA polymerase sigma-70 factor (ECF subfamily)